MRLLLSSMALCLAAISSSSAVLAADLGPVAEPTTAERLASARSAIQAKD